MAESPVPELKHVTRDRTTIAIPKAMRLDLARLRRELGFKTNGGLLRYMILETTRGELIAPASYQLVMARLGNRPVIMAGPSGAGKTTTVKAILAEWPGSVFILDMGDEYLDFKRLDFGKFYAVNWQHEGQRLRFVPNSNTQISQAEASNIFGHLNFIKSGGALKNWVRRD